GVEADVETVSSVDPDPVTDCGANDAVAPAGSPVALNETTPLKLVPPAIVAVYVVPVPCDTVRDVGVAESEKSAAVIGRVAATLVRPPLSVTVSEATYVPGVAYVTLLGFACELELGLPPGNVHA